MNYILFDGNFRNQLLPFTYTRPVADIRVGILTIREKWEHFLETTTSTITEDYLSQRWPLVELEENIFINAAFLPSTALVAQIKALKKNEVLIYDDIYVAFKAAEDAEVDLDHLTPVDLTESPLIIQNTWDIFSKNSLAIEADFKLITAGRTSAEIPASVHCLGKENIFIEEGANVNMASLNAENGPIYIGKNAEIMEGSLVRGPFALCEHATLKMGAKIYGGTTIGPHSKVGGEVNNSVILGYSNKGHDGFLGNSVLGEWCNIGADSNNSNLKNNYAPVRLWDYETEGFADTGLQFCGLMMADHSKCGINTMFNTGTVVGVSANIYGGGFPRNFIPSFAWGGSSGMTTYKTQKAFEVAERVMQRRDIDFTEEDKNILTHIFDETEKYRKNFK
ncbi:UDP-N-acetylglucosamine diphosphorylase/glucosamine-1-phosphate N-acetyltransferase [Mesonia hippocampi]|uniref:UDP-N-acetylglucosamine diphosphorylase/glucosamine-1-phosphate N-acetyltransferase n=1 Tax=Mesonia hippocampi TaxID=1628250 RepID=A0A840EM75_9FLAO|nr:GlmU family protein [Mesonia hippocampi]MBB4117733.1 UDP-N-acetylglucosamine diphosphorylase/glucosamine-1-phosphate N-acetyltransferase [Mesonia hippocampi]